MISCPRKGCKGTVTYRFNVPTCSEHGVIPTVPQTAPAGGKPKAKRKAAAKR